MRNIKVTILTTSYPLDSKSCSGIFIYRMIQFLPNTVDVTVIVPDNNQKKTVTQNTKPIIHTFRYAPIKLQILSHLPGGIPVVIKRQPLALLLIPGMLISMFISTLVLSRKNDLIHANWSICGLIGGLAAKIIKKPIITTFRGEDITRAQKSFIDRQILKICLILNTQTTAVSQTIVDWIKSNFPQHKDKIHLIENGVDPRLLAIERTFHTFLPTTTIQLITIGSLIKRKNILTIVQAIPLLRKNFNIQLSIVGSGPEEHELKEFVIKSNLSDYITFTGEANPESIPEVLKHSDIFILSSLSEGRPNVILEAMAAALPIIATDISGVNELITNNDTGLLFMTGDYEQLADHITMLITNHKSREQLGTNARNFILQHQLTWQHTGMKYTELYTKVRQSGCVE